MFYAAQQHEVSYNKQKASKDYHETIEWPTTRRQNKFWHRRHKRTINRGSDGCLARVFVSCTILSFFFAYVPEAVSIAHMSVVLIVCHVTPSLITKRPSGVSTDYRRCSYQYHWVSENRCSIGDATFNIWEHLRKSRIFAFFQIGRKKIVPVIHSIFIYSPSFNTYMITYAILKLHWVPSFTSCHFHEFFKCDDYDNFLFLLILLVDCFGMIWTSYLDFVSRLLGWTNQ